jgi:indolepyruvate ferredoxin oxidoreductase
MSLIETDLNDKFRVRAGRLYMSGTQALVRLLLVQKWRDAEASLNTTGFVSGYRGSPLGGFDRELWRAEKFLEHESIRFWPGINEDLAATAVWGTQFAGLKGDWVRDGIFGLWYGKGAGLDRSGDAIRHANAAGVNPRGGVLAVIGDDHAQKSSTNPYFCEPTCADLLMPVLYPATIAELLQYGILGWAMSRFSGVWVGLKTMAELLDCSTSFHDASVGMPVRLPEASPSLGSLHLRVPDAPWNAAETRWIEHRLPAVHAFARANRVDRISLAAATPRLGIITAGKTHRDVLQALQDLGVSLDEAAALGISIYKVGMTWPLEIAGLRAFAAGIPELLVIEEKRPIIEDQVRVALSADRDRPLITGKKDENGAWQFPWIGELGAAGIARVLARKLGVDALPSAAAHRLTVLDAADARLKIERPIVDRPAYFCSGCPHSTSTRLPEGSRAIAGVGCHYMAAQMDRETGMLPQMGGEGAMWIGQAPFSATPHVFANLGEGTYFHSGSLAIRACISAGVNITYKLLYNDAVAMTGGQPVDGPLSVPQLAWQLYAEGVRGIRIVAEEPAKYRRSRSLPPGTSVDDRSRLDEVQRELRAIPGVTALIYDQTCAAEKRRRRKRKQLGDPAKRTYINPAVCEGCGDCSQTSNCLSVVPIETEHGRKRAIEQSSCNKDFSCVEGFCPSFVTVAGGSLRRPHIERAGASNPWPEPQLAPLDSVYDIFITGVGGTGVVTVGALLGMAAHLEGKACSILDQLGMAQKGGAVVSHVRLAGSPDRIAAARVSHAGADLLLGFDLAVALQTPAFSTLAPGRTRAVLNTHETVTGAFTRNPDMVQPTQEMVAAIRRSIGDNRVEAFDATLLATSLLGDSIATNLLVLGFAFQKGLIPLSRAAILQAIRLNGVAVDFSIKSFEWGRRAAMEGAAARSDQPALSPSSPDLDDLLERRVALLTQYQDASYAQQFREFIAWVRSREELRLPGSTRLARAVAVSLYKLMAYKDEYEVARLYTDGEFTRAIRESFTGDFKLSFHLAPPIFGRKDPKTGVPRKQVFGPWMYAVFQLLARLRKLRGTRWDPFGYTEERRMERRLISEYRSVIERIMAGLTPDKHALAVKIAEIPLSMRGYGYIKQRNVAAALAREAQLLAEFSASPPEGEAVSRERHRG